VGGTAWGTGLCLALGEASRLWASDPQSSFFLGSESLSAGRTGRDDHDPELTGAPASAWWLSDRCTRFLVLRGSWGRQRDLGGHCLFSGLHSVQHGGSLHAGLRTPGVPSPLPTHDHGCRGPRTGGPRAGLEVQGPGFFLVVLGLETPARRGRPGLRHPIPTRLSARPLG
jgi:hypothetical protein